MRSRQTRLTFLGVALGVLLALIIAPQTRWLVRIQIAPGLINDTSSRRQFVESHPDDYPVQLGGQMNYETQTQLDYARSLVPRFPNNPSLRANILRYATMKDIHMNRPDADGALLSGTPPTALRPDSSTPAQLAAFDTDAAAGERLDPDNAYFPFMRAIGLFAAHRDAEGLAAVTRAGAKTAWREYYEDEVEGHWRLQDAVYGHREAIGCTAIFASVLFPHYSSLRAVARLVTTKAMEEELAGNREEGLTQRRSLARCGDLMRAQGTTYIANLVGIAISAISRTRPGGAAPIKSDADSATPQIRTQLLKKRLDAYCEYVTRLGHPDAAREAREQTAAGEQVRHLNIDLVSGTQLKDLFRLASSLALGWILVSSLALLGLLGAAAWGLSRLPRLRDRQPLPAGATVGIWAVLLLALAALICFHDARPEEILSHDFIFVLLLVVPLAAFSLYAWFQPNFRKPFGYAVLAGCLTLTALAFFVGLAAWQMNGVDSTLITLNRMMPSFDTDSENSPSAASLAQTQIAIGLAFASALPLLLIVIFSIAARVRRVPISVGLVAGFRTCTPALLCALTILYAVLTLWTVRQENQVNYDAERSLHGEAQYLAELAGKPWPGLVR